MEWARFPAASCRELAAHARFGALATLHVPTTADADSSSGSDRDLWPFASLVAIASDDLGRPLLLLSRLAEHTKNLEQCSRVSLLVSEPDPRSGPLAAARMTILGVARQVPDPERPAAASTYLAAHPDAETQMGFGDFRLWRIEVAHVRWVAGFGRMGWVEGADYGVLTLPPSLPEVTKPR
ncbi:MAG: CREG family protein [Polyangiaceae bacterium]|nr:CREG family protein [Polyangiaceae bacterium]